MAPHSSQKQGNDATTRPTSRDPTELASIREPEAPGGEAGACSLPPTDDSGVAATDDVGEDPGERPATPDRKPYQLIPS